MSIYTVTFGATYTNAVVDDIGKTVVQGASTGTLIWYDNTATVKKWRVDSASFTSGVTTITGGTGAGTSTAVSNTVPVETRDKEILMPGRTTNLFTKFVYLDIIKVNVTIYAQVSLSGAEISIYDLDNSPAGSLGSQLQHTESHGSANYTINQLSPGNVVWIQVMLDGYEEFGLSFTMPSSNSTLPIVLKAEQNA